ncbi:UNVERIFIED_CONTAM: hypothetical protein GTU68_023204 [Idotea baltica]|nr:hypothetical protein [Idotea baltica]
MKQNIVASKGCIDVTLLQHNKNPNIFFTYSHWTSEDALNNYRYSKLFRSTWARVKLLFAQAPQAWSSKVLGAAKRNFASLDYENTLSAGDYNIYFGNANELLLDFLSVKKYSSVFVLVDENTKQHCLPILLNSLNDSVEVIEIESGEKNKNLNTCKHIWQYLINSNASRNSLLINLGGGVIGDMGGFCASSYKRGIDFIQIPTTLLSQVDASVGGKLGIDFMGLKNVIGQFNNPQKVIIDTQFLKTLPYEELRSGFAEMLKHSLISNQESWHNLSIYDLQSINYVQLNELIIESVKIKRDIVEQDPYEKNIRKALNLGHTIGHAVETHFLNSNKPILHGNAVAYGIVAETYISVQKGLISISDYGLIKAQVNRLYPKIEIAKSEILNVINFTRNDKKNINSKINATLLTAIGKFEINHQLLPKEIEQAILHLNNNY